MKKILIIIGLVCCMSTNLFGFATLTAPQGGDSIRFDTNIGDVDIYLNGVIVGKKDANSFVYKLKRTGEDQIFIFKKDGYKDATVTVTRALAPTFWLNVIIGGLLGSSTDSIFTKNSMEYSPNQYYVQLNKL